MSDAVDAGETPNPEDLEQNQADLTEELQTEPAAAEIAEATEGEVGGQPGQ